MSLNFLLSWASSESGLEAIVLLIIASKHYWVHGAPFAYPCPAKPHRYIYIYTCAWVDQYYWRIWHKWVYRRDANFMFANLVCILNTAQPFYHALLEAPATFTNFISSLGFQSLYCQDMKRMMTSILQGEWLFPSSLSLQHFIQMVNIIASRI